MYVIIHKNRVVLGILPWNSQYFTDVLRSRYRITTELPRNEPASDAFPWEIDAETKIFPAEEIRPNIDNPLVEYYYGPTWEFLETKVIASYDVLPQSIEDARGNYKVKASLQRYEQEISGTTITINGVEYKIETDRLSRTKFIEKYISMGDTVNWKFNEGWVVLTKEQIYSIVFAIDTYVQAAFDEELRLNAVIDTCETAEQLEAVEELNKKPNDGILEQPTE